MKFQSNPFSLSKVIESLGWFSHIHSTLTVCKMKNKTSFEIRAYIKGHAGLNVSVSQIYSELCQIHRTSVVSKRSIFRWHKKFKGGKTALKDEPCPGVTVSFFPHPKLPLGEKTDRLVSSPGKKWTGWFLSPPPPPPPTHTHTQTVSSPP